MWICQDERQMRRLLDEDDSPRNTDRSAMRWDERTLKQVERFHRVQAIASREVRRRGEAGRCDPPDHRQRDRRRSRGAESLHRQPSTGRWCRESRHSVEEDSPCVWVRPARDRADGTVDPSKRASVPNRSTGAGTSNRDQPSRDQPSPDRRGSPDNRHKLPKPDVYRRRKKQPNTGTASCLCAGTASASEYPATA